MSAGRVALEWWSLPTTTVAEQSPETTLAPNAWTHLGGSSRVTKRNGAKPHRTPAVLHRYMRPQ
jgi:hypothetical protein